jgi:hypothetical protein
MVNFLQSADADGMEMYIIFHLFTDPLLKTFGRSEKCTYFRNKTEVTFPLTDNVRNDRQDDIK